MIIKSIASYYWTILARTRRPDKPCHFIVLEHNFYSCMNAWYLVWCGLWIFPHSLSYAENLAQLAPFFSCK